MGGGQGTRLYPLTASRCKPAISFGGRYRLIDIPISNAINSGCKNIYIITQFLSASLHKHIFNTYPASFYQGGSIEILSAEQKVTTASWFQGPADAVRQNLEYLLETPVEYFLILSGDQLYNIDFCQFAQFAQDTDADLAIASLPVDENNAKRMGILKVDKQSKIIDFFEKPQEKKDLDAFKSPASIFSKCNLIPGTKKQYLGSMGIYLFKKQALVDLLMQDTREDFGKHLIPTKVRQGRAAAFLYDGYWEDIGTIESFYHANMALTQCDPVFNLYDNISPIYTNSLNLPGPKIANAHISHSIICEGSVVEANEVTNSILGPRSVIHTGSEIKNSYLMGNDFYTSPVKKCLPNEPFIGKNCKIHRTIVDENVCIGNNVQLINKQGLSHFDSETVYIREGIIIVTRGAQIPDGFIL